MLEMRSASSDVLKIKSKLLCGYAYSSGKSREGMVFYFDSSLKKIYDLLDNTLVFVGVECAGGVDDRTSRFGSFDSGDEQLKLCSSDLVYFFFSSKREGAIRFVSCAFTATRGVDQYMIKRFWKMFSKHSTVSFGQCGVV